MNNLEFKPPGTFRPNADENVMQAWKEWKQQFQLFLTAKGVTKTQNGMTCRTECRMTCRMECRMECRIKVKPQI